MELFKLNHVLSSNFDYTITLNTRSKGFITHNNFILLKHNYIH